MDLKTYLGSLHVVQLDVANIRPVNTKAGELFGDQVIAINAKNFLTLGDDYGSGLLRIAGDELLGLVGPQSDEANMETAKITELLMERNQNTLSTIQIKLPILKDIVCNFNIKAVLPLANLGLPKDKNRRASDLSQSLYHAIPNQRGTSAPNMLAELVNETLSTNSESNSTRSFSTLVRKLPLYLKKLASQANNNNPVLRNLLEQAAFNPNYERTDVYNPRAFLNTLVEAIGNNDDKNIQVLMVAPIWLKNINIESYSAGSKLLSDSVTLLEQNLGKKIVGITQTGGSLLIAVDETRGDNVAETITQLLPTNNDKCLVATNISMGNSAKWKEFVEQSTVCNNPDLLTPQFWQELVDPHRPIHYISELNTVISALETPEQRTRIWEFIKVRLSTRIDTLMIQLAPMVESKTTIMPVSFLKFYSSLPEIKDGIFNSTDSQMFTQSIQKLHLGLDELNKVRPFAPPPRPHSPAPD
jgi:hypothetical protein